MGAINSTHKLTIDSMALLEMLEPNTQEINNKLRVHNKIQAILMKTWPTIHVVAFGSSQSGLAFGQSDLDLGIFFHDLSPDCYRNFTPQERIGFLTNVSTCLNEHFEVIEVVHSARVPVVKLRDRELDIACDVCIGSTHVLLNTMLLKHYSQLDRRVRPLIFAVKYWAKQRGINDPSNGTLSSYAWVLLVLFYLQSNAILPPVSPIFTSILSESSIVRVLERLELLPSYYHPEQPSESSSSTQSSVGALLKGFFQFYISEFKYETDVVSVRIGAAISKASTWNRLVPWRISIEDPFEVSHDVGRVVFSPKGQELLKSEFLRALEVININGRLEAVCTTNEKWNCLETCYICQSRDHTPRECAQSADSCWYCGDRGHVKYTCPMYAFLDIAHPTSIAPLSTPLPIISPSIAPQHDHFKILNQEEFMHVPIKGKKKKRRRHGSISSMGSSPDQDRSRKCSVTSRVRMNRKINKSKDVVNAH